MALHTLNIDLFGGHISHMKFKVNQNHFSTVGKQILTLFRCILEMFFFSFNLYLNSKWICHELQLLKSMLPLCSTVCVVASGFPTPRYRHNWTEIWFLETKFILPFFARTYTVKCCLLLIFVLIVCLLTLKSRFFASGFRNQESGIGLSNNL